jgi:hypothetical protein
VSDNFRIIFTKNGTGRYAIVDTTEYDFLYRMAFDESFKKLNENRIEAEREGWITKGAVRERFGIPADA